VAVLGLAEAAPARCWPAAERALVAELELLGFTVIVQPLATTELSRHEPFVAQAAALGVEAALLIIRDADGGPRSTLIVVDRVTGKSLERVLDPGVGRDDPSFAATRAVETLRASLIELRLAASPPPPPQRPPQLRRPADEATLSPGPVAGTRGPVFSLAAAGAVVTSPAPSPGLVGVSVEARLSPIDWLVLGLDVTLAPFGTTVRTEAGGEAELTLAAFRLFTLARWRPLTPLTVELGPGGGALLASAVGRRSAEDLALRKDRAVVGHLGGRLRAAVNFWGPLSLVATGTLGACLPEVVVRHDGSAAARLGRPLAEASLGVEISAR